MIRILLYFWLWFLSMGIAIFATQNTLSITLKFLVFDSIKLPLGLVLVFCAGVGAIAVTILQSFPKLPNYASVFSRRSTPSKDAFSASAPPPKDTKKATSTPSKKASKDDFDEEWDDDWD
ncbi:LapA family protein [Tumidithrix elongata RA019]|uniref:LapA family protein n=1 Tax=Tumidithrix elongata BACA0141 TaxID=2716417 RepID=A0AAW9PXK4_9CYAN|nr:LapA family protein [Tumidithrix elongata RA019]